MAAGKDPKEVVLKYLRDQNRPYSVNDILLNLHKELGKTAIQKALDSLTQETKVIEKINGKQKAYAVSQQDLPTASEEELKTLDLEINKINEELKTSSEILRNKENLLKKFGSSLSTAQAKNKTEELKVEMKELQKKLDKFSDKGNLITKEEKLSIDRKHETGVKEWKKRKRMCLDVTDAILENYPKSKKHLYEEIGFETDESAGVKMPDMY